MPSPFRRDHLEGQVTRLPTLTENRPDGGILPTDLITVVTDPVTDPVIRQVPVSAFGSAALNVKAFGAVGDGVTDDTAAIQRAIDAAAVAVSGARGATVVFPRGTFIVSSQITLPNRVALSGSNGRGTIIKASAGHTGPWMFNAVNGTVSMFGSTISAVQLDANSVAGLGCVLADAWQENSGMKGVICTNFRTSALRLQNGYGGAAYTTVEDCEFFGSASGATYGIDVDTISVAGGFQLHVVRTTITGSVGALLTAGINITTDALIADVVHFEYCENGVLLNGISSSLLQALTGGPDVTDVVEIASGFTGQVNVLNLIPRAATNSVNNAVTGEVLSGVVGYYSHNVYRHRAIFEGWQQDNVAASQTAVVLNRWTTAGTGSPAEAIPSRAGYLTGITVRSNAARTAGSLTCEVYINGTASGLTAVLDGTNTQLKTTTQSQTADIFTAGSRFGVRITTTADWAPTTEDIVVTVDAITL